MNGFIYSVLYQPLAMVFAETPNYILKVTHKRSPSLRMFYLQQYLQYTQYTFINNIHTFIKTEEIAL